MIHALIVRTQLYFSSFQQLFAFLSSNFNPCCAFDVYTKNEVAVYPEFVFTPAAKYSSVILICILGFFTAAFYGFVSVFLDADERECTLRSSCGHYAARDPRPLTLRHISAASYSVPGGRCIIIESSSAPHADQCT